MKSASFSSFLENLSSEKQVGTTHEQHCYFKSMCMWWYVYAYL